MTADDCHYIGECFEAFLTERGLARWAIGSTGAGRLLLSLRGRLKLAAVNLCAVQGKRPAVRRAAGRHQGRVRVLVRWNVDNRPAQRALPYVISSPHDVILARSTA
jgi:hypothetical protein